MKHGLPTSALSRLAALLVTLLILPGSTCDEEGPALLPSHGGPQSQGDTGGADGNATQDGDSSRSGDERADRLSRGRETTNISSSGTDGPRAGEACSSDGTCGGDLYCLANECTQVDQMQVSLSWSTQVDLDLYVKNPAGETIYYRNREGADGAEFQSDRCIVDCDDELIRETVIWKGAPRKGTYTVWAKNFDGRAGTSFQVEVARAGQIETFSGSVTAQEGSTSQEFTFTVEEPSSGNPSSSNGSNNSTTTPTRSAFNAPCNITVDGYGSLNIEERYLAGVVACENGNAPPEALKAQAIQARGMIFYLLSEAGVRSVSNSEDDQVFRCSSRPNGPGPEHIEAVRATRGQYLQWKGKVVAPFYVAGSEPPNPASSCRGTGVWSSTERYVTYNEGKTGCNVSMTSLGWNPADCNSNPHNRGAASQHGQACLANAGRNHQEMIRYYYGNDIEIVTASGACGG